MKTFTFELTDKYFSKDEQDVFKDYLKHHSLESNIWDVFASLFNSGTRHTKPFLLKTYRGPDLVGAAIVIKCNRYGRALFNNRILSGLMDLFNIPFSIQQFHSSTVPQFHNFTIWSQFLSPRT